MMVALIWKSEKRKQSVHLRQVAHEDCALKVTKPAKGIISPSKTLSINTLLSFEVKNLCTAQKEYGCTTKTHQNVRPLWIASEIL